MLRVAVIGSGPAGMYAIGHLLSEPDGVVASVTLIDRLPTPFGLIRAGVAPDHQQTKKVQRGFGRHLRDPRVRCHFGVDVGRHITHADILAHHHAAIYAVGAPGSRSLGIVGEQLPGSYAATDFVAWYNGHPDAADMSFDLSSPRVMVVGSGNVALDVARILTQPISKLRTTDISDRALAVLARSAVQEVVVLARGGPGSASFTYPELLALTQLDDVDLEISADLNSVPEPPNYADRAKLQLLREVTARRSRHGRRRIVLRFLTSPIEVLGHSRVVGLRLRRNEIRDGRVVPTSDISQLDTSLVLRSIGYRGRPVPGLPFDENTGTIPHDAGRVSRGTYVTGWIKRGPSGVIGTNKYDAAETVTTLLNDANSGRIGTVLGSSAHFDKLIDRLDNAIGIPGWTAIDTYERQVGLRQNRPRVKATDYAQLQRVARSVVV